jgi:hypothetical protein
VLIETYILTTEEQVKTSVLSYVYDSSFA